MAGWEARRVPLCHAVPSSSLTLLGDSGNRFVILTSPKYFFNAHFKTVILFVYDNSNSKTITSNVFMCSKSTIDREDKNHSAILFSVPVFVDLFRLAEKERSSHCIQSRTSQMLIKNRKSQVLVQVGGS